MPGLARRSRHAVPEALYQWQPFKRRPHLASIATGSKSPLMRQSAFLSVSVVPRLQVSKLYCANGRQLRLARIRPVGSVDQLCRLALRNPFLIVIAANDPCGHLLLRKAEVSPG